VRTAAAQPPEQLQLELLACLRQLNLRCRANDVTPDGCVYADVLVRLPASASSLAIELVQARDTSRNTGRLLGPAALRWRLLRARGYKILQLPASEWRRAVGQDAVSRLLFLQTLLSTAEERALETVVMEDEGGRDGGVVVRSREGGRRRQALLSARA
jgi:hypothetical protein